MWSVHSHASAPSIHITGKEYAMCDYSLYHRASRPAKVGERLVTTQFAYTITRGFTAPSDPSVAVCVLPGTEISFAESVRVRTNNPFMAVVNDIKQAIGVPPKALDLTATFIQVDKEKHAAHHDALQLPDGSIVLLTHLEPGQEATVLTLPANPQTLAEKEHQRRAEYV
jgi:hypothetical protein